MNKLIILLGLMFSFSTFANQIELNSKTIELGKLKGNPTDTVIEIVRTAQTPKKVKANYQLPKLISVCAETRTRVIHIPGRTVVHCRNTERGRVCRTTWIPPRTRYESYCARYEPRLVFASKTLNLDFKKAAKLADDDREVFAINIRQENRSDVYPEISGKSVITEQDYKIRLKKFFGKLRGTLEFIAK